MVYKYNSRSSPREWKSVSGYRAVVQRHKEALPAPTPLPSRPRGWHRRLRLSGRVYQNLTHLDVSENNIESLDLSVLERLENVLCSRNQLLELSLNGTSLALLEAVTVGQCNINLACNGFKVCPPP
ncbi:PH domain leucine-rich repeat-containing protein phosphatase 2 [Homalodisca vitripennis]|nr:PH domain leucine-rich repeat-containing protein phosphatase 2 [Homalodisca vitripennis]